MESAAEGERIHQVMMDQRALALKQQDEDVKAQAQIKVKQAEFEQRKKDAVELGMKPGSAEYTEYVRESCFDRIADFLFNFDDFAAR